MKLRKILFFQSKIELTQYRYNNANNSSDNSSDNSYYANLSEEDKQAIKKLEDYVNKGYLTKEEYETKKNKILSK